MTWCGRAGAMHGCGDAKGAGSGAAGIGRDGIIQLCTGDDPRQRWHSHEGWCRCGARCPSGGRIVFLSCPISTGKRARALLRSRKEHTSAHRVSNRSLACAAAHTQHRKLACGTRTQISIAHGGAVLPGRGRTACAFDWSKAKQAWYVGCTAVSAESGRCPGAARAAAWSSVGAQQLGVIGEFGRGRQPYIHVSCSYVNRD